jgi:hypothetical protein
VKDNSFKGKEVLNSTQVNAEASSSKQTLDTTIKDPNIGSTDSQNLTLAEKLSARFNKIRKAVQASDDEEDLTKNV